MRRLCSVCFELNFPVPTSCCYSEVSLVRNRNSEFDCRSTMNSGSGLSKSTGGFSLGCQALFCAAADILELITSRSHLIIWSRRLRSFDFLKLRHALW